MKKIIKHGTRKTTCCEYCGCEFSYEAEDVNESKVSDIQNNTFTQHFVECPQCDRNVYLDSQR